MECKLLWSFNDDVFALWIPAYHVVVLWTLEEAVENGEKRIESMDEPRTRKVLLRTSPGAWNHFWERTSVRRWRRRDLRCRCCSCCLRCCCSSSRASSFAKNGGRTEDRGRPSGGKGYVEAGGGPLVISVISFCPNSSNSIVYFN